MLRDSQFSQEGHVLNGCFFMCRSKLMSAIQIRPIQLEKVMHFPEYICRELMKKNGVKCCGDGSTCWRHDLKDVKIKGTDGEIIRCDFVHCGKKTKLCYLSVNMVDW